ncbi:hypothetical protein Csa_016494 [Cucumis sativus]|uniref:Uncharacterized protein n=1 Tax=Cucumis sativus TaxID=3659 RepID=A0A0A0KB94_CUCSA|nr:hypothetical protein Csa_016494 [Cucumis sativus]
MIIQAEISAKQGPMMSMPIPIPFTEWLRCKASTSRATSMALQPCTPSTKKCDLRSRYKSTHCRQSFAATMNLQLEMKRSTWDAFVHVSVKILLQLKIKC